MKKVVRAYPARDLHVVLDNSSTHNTDEVRAWLAAHPRVQFHYTPTSASWLNQIEGFFGILTKQSLSVTDFPSTRALMDHLRAYLARGTSTRRPSNGRSRLEPLSNPTSECLTASQRRCTSQPFPAAAVPTRPAGSARRGGRAQAGGRRAALHHPRHATAGQAAEERPVTE